MTGSLIPAFVARIVISVADCSRADAGFIMFIVPFAVFTPLAVAAARCVTGVTVTDRFLSPALPLFLGSGAEAVISVAAFAVIAAATVIEFVRGVTAKCFLPAISVMTQTVFHPVK